MPVKTEIIKLTMIAVNPSLSIHSTRFARKFGPAVGA